MNKNQRIKSDFKTLKNNNYKKPRLHKAFNYYQDWSNAVMLYVCEKDKHTFIKYSMPKNFNIYLLYEQYVLPKIKHPIQNTDMEYTDKGAIFNIMLKNNKILYAKIEPNMKMHFKEVDFNGKTKKVD